MKRLSVTALAIVLVACGSDDRGNSPTTTVTPTSVTTSTAPTTTSTTDIVTTTTTTTLHEEVSDPGTESVGVTDKVTIIILDPED